MIRTGQIDTTGADGSCLAVDGGRAAPSGSLTGAVRLPIGTAADRPATARQGSIRFETDTGRLTVFDGTNWQQESYSREVHFHVTSTTNASENITGDHPWRLVVVDSPWAQIDTSDNRGVLVSRPGPYLIIYRDGVYGNRTNAGYGLTSVIFRITVNGTAVCEGHCGNVMHDAGTQSGGGAGHTNGIIGVITQLSANDRVTANSQADVGNRTSAVYTSSYYDPFIVLLPLTDD